MKYMTECSVCGGGTNNPKGRCVGHYTPPASQESADRKANVQGYCAGIPWSMHLRAWDTYAKRYGSRQSAERIHERGGFHVAELDEFIPGWRDELSIIATLTAEVARLTGELAERRDAAEVFKGMYYIAAKDRDDARALMTQSQNKNALNWSEPYHCPAHKAAVKDWAAQVTANERLTEKLAASRQECERLREVMTKAARMNMQARGPLEITDILHAALSASGREVNDAPAE